MKPLRIVLVEDDAMISASLAEMLTGMGHCICAVTATESGAVTAAIDHEPDLMIVDVELREGNGVSAMETILRNFRIPHLFISGGTHAGRSNAVALRKPFRELELVRAMEHAVCAAPPE